MNEQNKTPGQLAYEFLSSLSSNPLFKWSSLDPQWQQSWEQTAAFMATQALAVKCDGNHAAPACLDPQCWHKGAPDRCPTCGSTEKQNRNKVFPSGSLCGDACANAWHTSAAATPAPEPWRPDLHEGDYVKLLREESSQMIQKHRDGWFKVEDGRWFSAATLMLVEYGANHLRALCGGNEPHRDDGWQQDWLSPGTRPLCKGETLQPSDQWKTEGFDEWNDVISETLKPENLVTAFCRTTRPAPTPAQAQNKCPKCDEDWSCHGDSSNTCTYSPAQAEPTAQTEEKTLAQTIAEIIMVDSDEFDGSIHAYLIDGFAMSGKRDYAEQHRLADLACEKIAQAAIAFAQSGHPKKVKEDHYMLPLCANHADTWFCDRPNLLDALKGECWICHAAQSSCTEQASSVMPSVEELLQIYDDVYGQIGFSGEESSVRRMEGISAVREACMRAQVGNMLTCPFCHESDFDTEGLSGHLSRYCEKSGTRWQDRENWKQRAEKAEQTIADLRKENDNLTTRESLAINALRTAIAERDEAKARIKTVEFEHRATIDSCNRWREDAKKSDAELTAAREALRTAEGDLRYVREEREAARAAQYQAENELTSLKSSSGWVALESEKPANNRWVTWYRHQGSLTVVWTSKAGNIPWSDNEDGYHTRLTDLRASHWKYADPLPSSSAPPPSPEEGETLIITNHVFPPIPIRTHDWSAYRDGYEAGDPIGWGETEEAAIADLKEKGALGSVES